MAVKKYYVRNNVSLYLVLKTVVLVLLVVTIWESVWEWIYRGEMWTLRFYV